MLPAQFHGKNFPPNCLCVNSPDLHIALHIQIKRKEDQDLFLVDPAFFWTWFCSPTHQCYIWVTTLISMRRQVCKRHGLQEEDQALHIQCETLKIINEEIAEGTAYTRTITNELFWEWQWWRLEDEKKVKIFHQLQTSIWKTRRWSKQRKNKIYILPRKPASSHTIHHVTTLNTTTQNISSYAGVLTGKSGVERFSFPVWTQKICWSSGLATSRANTHATTSLNLVLCVTGTNCVTSQHLPN